MPLDGHSYLVSQGWTGKGTGLRQGAISRPLAIPQKKNLAGLGKDRDEAFPFWDHLFSAAAKSIQLKVASDDESDAGSSVPEFKRTATGIFSNRRPVTGVSATPSGASTPNNGNEVPQSNLISIAKREAARSSLYARFFRGPVLGPQNDYSSTQLKPVAESSTGQPVDTSIKEEKKGTQEHNGDEVQISDKKRKRGVEDNAERRRRKKERKERKEQKAKEKEERKALRRGRKAVKDSGKKLSSEEMKRQETKRQKRALKEKEVVCQMDDDVMSNEGRKEKKDGASRPQDRIVEHSDGHPQARGQRPHPPENDLEEGKKKKKRKRTEE